MMMVMNVYSYLVVDGTTSLAGSPACSLYPSTFSSCLY